MNDKPVLTATFSLPKNCMSSLIIVCFPEPMRLQFTTVSTPTFSILFNTFFNMLQREREKHRGSLPAAWLVINAVTISLRTSLRSNSYLFILRFSSFSIPPFLSFMWLLQVWLVGSHATRTCHVCKIHMNGASSQGGYSGYFLLKT